MDNAYNFNNLIDRAKYCADLAGNPSRLAKETGMARSNIWRIVESGADMTTESALRIARAVGVDVGWLVSGEGSPHPDERKSRILKVRLLDQNDFCPVLFEEHFFLNYISSTPESCRAIQMNDPDITSISKAAWSIIDENSTNERSGFYALRFKNQIQIRILDYLPTGSLNVRSEKTTNYTLSPEEKAQLAIAGKLIWWECRNP